jgi:hypothetical protein
LQDDPKFSVSPATIPSIRAVSGTAFTLVVWKPAPRSDV